MLRGNNTYRYYLGATPFAGVRLHGIRPSGHQGPIGSNKFIMKIRLFVVLWVGLALPWGTSKTIAAAGPVKGWLSWRGPYQGGMSLEKGLLDKIDSKVALWTAEYLGQSTPVIANGMH